MRILVAVVSSNKLVCRTFLANHAQILNGEFMPKGLRGQVSFATCALNPDADNKPLDQFLLDQSGTTRADGVTVLLDHSFAHMADGIRSAVFLGIVNFGTYIPNVRNLLSATAAKLLRNFGHLLIQLRPSTSFHAAALPIRNFTAQELIELVNVCRDRTLESTFPHEIEPHLNGLVSRRGPKRRSNYPTQYFRDDKALFFQYGHEEHSRFETGGDHLVSCHMNGHFRFGKRLDDGRHFNVTQGDSDGVRINEKFRNCHDAAVTITNRSHVNMFSNDFHK